MTICGLLAFLPCGVAQEPASISAELSELQTAFYELLGTNDFVQADQRLEKIFAHPGKEALGDELPHMLVALGNHLCETDDLTSAKKWLDRLDAEYGKRRADEEMQLTFHDLIKDKIAWIKDGGKREWVNPDARALADSILAALKSGTPADLEKSLAKVDTYVGWWESEYEPTTSASVLEHIKKYRQDAMTWVNPEDMQKAIASGDRVLYMNTHGWLDMEGGFKNIQFGLHKVSSGWEWRGIVLGETTAP
jgi:hypothetical protein